MYTQNRLTFPISIVKGISPKIQKVINFGELIEEKKSRYPKEKEQVSKLRSDKQNDPGTYKKNKERLAGFVIGEFSKRNDSCCKKYIPCLAFDLDGIGEDLASILLSDLKQIPYVFSAFLSPGAGLRVLVWCASDQNSHKNYYKAFCEHLSDQLGDFIKTDVEWRKEWKEKGLEKKEIESTLKKTPHIDTSTSNISRMWFYVPLPKNEIYLNLNSQVFYVPDVSNTAKNGDTSDEKPKKTQRPLIKSVPASNGQVISESEKIEMCEQKVNRKNPYAKRNDFIYALAAEMCLHGVPNQVALSHCFKYAEPNDPIDPFRQEEIKKSVDSAYRSKTFANFTDGNSLNYKKIGEKKTSNGTLPAKKNEAVKIDKGGKEETRSQPTKKSKFVQIEEYLFEKYEFRKNIISIDIEYRKKGSNYEYKELNENDLIIELLRMGYTGVEAPLIALLKSSLVPEYDPFLAYKESLPKWTNSQPDHVTQLANFVKAKDQYWFNTQFKKSLVRTAACALNIIPFNKHCLTLLGKQNDGKSSFLRFLCPSILRKYLKEDIDFNNKDGRLALCTNFFINLDELASLSKYELNKIKNLFTLDQVKERLPYDRKPSVFPRRASFLASTNEEEFLTDSTGNVRWLVFEIDGINHNNGGKNGYSQNINIDLVWSQVFYLLDNSFDFKLSVDEIKKSELNNKRHKVITAEFEFVQKHFLAGSKSDGDKFYRTGDVQNYLREKYMGINFNVNKIGKALKELGIERIQTTTGQNTQERGYFLKER